MRDLRRARAPVRRVHVAARDGAAAVRRCHLPRQALLAPRQPHRPVAPRSGRRLRGAVLLLAAAVALHHHGNLQRSDGSSVAARRHGGGGCARVQHAPDARLRRRRDGVALLRRGELGHRHEGRHIAGGHRRRHLAEHGAVDRRRGCCIARRHAGRPCSSLVAAAAPAAAAPRVTGLLLQQRRKRFVVVLSCCCCCCCCCWCFPSFPGFAAPVRFPRRLRRRPARRRRRRDGAVQARVARRRARIVHPQRRGTLLALPRRHVARRRRRQRRAIRRVERARRAERRDARAALPRAEQPGAVVGRQELQRRLRALPPDEHAPQQRGTDAPLDPEGVRVRGLAARQPPAPVVAGSALQQRLALVARARHEGGAVRVVLHAVARAHRRDARLVAAVHADQVPAAAVPVHDHRAAAAAAVMATMAVTAQRRHGHVAVVVEEAAHARIPRGLQRRERARAQRGVVTVVDRHRAERAYGPGETLEHVGLHALHVQGEVVDVRRGALRVQHLGQREGAARRRR